MQQEVKQELDKLRMEHNRMKNMISELKAENRRLDAELKSQTNLIWEYLGIKNDNAS